VKGREVEAVRSGPVARRTALVVEEESGQRAATRQMLERNGFAVVSAADGPSALALSRRHDGDIALLLTDFLMPSMPGAELAERIRRQRPDIAVIYMSEFAFDAARPPALIQKPFDEAQLLEVVRSNLPD
jgi:two-component system cell cycle sensor histidine kinase/response regulator CckA